MDFPSKRKSGYTNTKVELTVIDLDRTDAKLLNALQLDGRTSYEKLGHHVGLTRIAARNRVQRLQAAGIIRIITVVHPAAVGLTTFAHLTLQVKGPAAPVAETLASHSGMPFISLTTGSFALIAEVRVRSLQELRTTVTQVSATAGVTSVTTCLYTQRVIDRHATQKVDAEPLHIDAVDAQIIGVLQRDGRATFAQIARHIGLSTTAVRARIRRLIDSGTVHVGAITQPESSSNLGYTCGFGVRTAVTGHLANALAGIPQIHYLSHCLGNWGLIGTLNSRTPAEAAALLDRIRGQGVMLDSWGHLSVIKEDYSVPLQSLSDAALPVVQRVGTTAASGLF